MLSSLSPGSKQRFVEAYRNSINAEATKIDFQAVLQQANSASPLGEDAVASTG